MGLLWTRSLEGRFISYYTFLEVVPTINSYLTADYSLFADISNMYEQKVRYVSEHFVSGVPFKCALDSLAYKIKQDKSFSAINEVKENITLCLF